MPEKAGDVYVKIHFSSSGREFRDEVEKDKEFEKGGKAAGDSAGEGYRDAFGDKLRQSLDDQEKIERKRGSIVQRETTKTTKRIGVLWDKFYKDQEDNTNNLRRSLDDIEVAWHAMSPEIANASGWTRGLSDEVDGVGDSVDESGRKTHRWSGFVRELGERFRGVGNAMDLLGNNASQLGGWLAGMHGEVDELDDSFDHADGKARVFAYRVETLGRRFGRLRGLASPLEGLFGRLFTPDRISKFVVSMRGMETTLAGIGKMGGRPRNDFINAIVVGFKGIFTLASKVPAVFAKIGETIGPNVVEPLEKAGEAAASAGEEAASAGEGVGAGMSSISVAAPAAIAALVAVEVILGFAASAAMLMTGAILALAAALSVALIGAVGAVAGVLLPLAAGIGAAAIAFATMDDKAKKALSGAIKPLKKELGELGGVARRAFVNTLFDTNDKAIQPGQFKGVSALKEALASLKPIFRAAGRGLGDFTQEILAGFQSKGFQDFIQTLAKFMPEAFRRVGRIAVNVGSFLGSVFEAVIPMAREFLGWLEGLTQSWANLGQGKGGGRIGKFFKDIGPTVDHVGDAIMEVIGLIGDLIAGPAQKAGGDMFKDIADNVHKFRDFLRDAKKDGSLEKFFEDSKKLARQIGNAVINIGKFVAALDTDDNRAAVIAIAKAFNAVLRASIQVAHWIEFINHWVWKLGGSQAWHAIVVGIKLIGLQFKIAWKLAKWAWDNIMAAGQKAHDKMHALFGSIGAWFSARWHDISKGAQNAWNAVWSGLQSLGGKIRAKVSDIGQWFRDLPSRIMSISWSNVGQTIGSAIFHAILAAMTGLPGQIVGLFVGLGSRIVSAIGSIIPHINWPDPPGWLKKVGGMVTASGGVFTGPQARIIGEAGPEAVVPLNRPLHMVDPAVRALSAFAQGKAGSTSTTTNGRRVDIGGITIITPTQDPRAVASQVINRIAAASYI